uniref:Uncharacterized protein n=1 Tax=Anguilla anguilla TaxID=7936 RepID=A0A0E9XHR2_ANGAN
MKSSKIFLYTIHMQAPLHQETCRLACADFLKEWVVLFSLYISVMFETFPSTSAVYFRCLFSC